MSHDLDITEVAVYTEDGRTSSLATFHGWDKREDGWWGQVFVYGTEGSYRDIVPAARLVPLVYCGRLPSGEIRHSDECLNLRQQPAGPASTTEP